MTFLDHLNSPKFDIMQNQSGGKMIKYRQSQALTSNFESFWSIVDCQLTNSIGADPGPAAPALSPLAPAPALL